ncbi:hypothetical protein XENTR_v10012823 [Xenopus tropicalis]|nr:hypothetical protein XENTR_v10012823 [Xenopus tropicalis]
MQSSTALKYPGLQLGSFPGQRWIPEEAGDARCRDAYGCISDTIALKTQWNYVTCIIGTNEALPFGYYLALHNIGLFGLQ